MTRPSYLILHGYQGSGPGHWQTWLAGRLRAGEATVAYPDLPDPDAPDLRAWQAALDGELDALEIPPIVVCHSLACLLWLHHAAASARPAARVLLVAPPSPSALERIGVEGFWPAPLAPAPLAASVLYGARLVCSDDDPYCPEGARGLYGEPLGLATDLLPGAGHVNPEAGYGPWPAVERWAREAAAPLEPAPAA